MTWLAAHTVSPLRMRLPAHPCPLAGAACASWLRSLAQSRANPLLKMPPGRKVPRPVSAITDSGAIAARCGGCVRCGEQLRDPGIRDPDHADLAVRDPRLRGDRLDDVVAVGRLQRLEELERAARATGAADVHADGREAERARDQRARLRRRRDPRASSRSTRRPSGTDPGRADRATSRSSRAACRRASAGSRSPVRCAVRRRTQGQEPRSRS